MALDTLKVTTIFYTNFPIKISFFFFPIIVIGEHVYLCLCFTTIWLCWKGIDEQVEDLGNQNKYKTTQVL
ncbi:hypothetical protein HanXRQr2_Chr07g0300531 [Helianthus annuus]|uniref:Uncharacterized protein n=1 Tax=Helianthus annuus TaxID=4232 RepID=A0A9K3NGX2_HELAN|nr:hypothetical protein HanXRQr2_Chr07g0300531 [Helianthus annuus]